MNEIQAMNKLYCQQTLQSDRLKAWEIKIERPAGTSVVFVKLVEIIAE
jgi:hypothetical protein